MIAPLKPNAHAAELMRLVDIMRDVLVYLATLTKNSSPKKDAFAEAVCEEQRVFTLLEAHMVELVARTTRKERQDLLKAFKNDIQFETRMDAPTFALQYPGLPIEVRKWAKPLLGAFYETLLERGVLKLTDGSGVRLDRHYVELGFFESNQNILACPACLESALLKPRDGKPSTNDCDHFLPKSKHGPLAVHPQNLAFICTVCNSRRKGQQDPLAGPNGDETRTPSTRAGALLGTYLPYHRPPGDELKLEFSRGAVTLTADREDERERVMALDRVFDLSGLWTQILPAAESEMFEAYQAEVGEDAKPETVKVEHRLEVFERMGARPVELLGPGKFLRGRYARHLREQHLGDIVKEWMQRFDEQQASRALYGKP